MRQVSLSPTLIGHALARTLYTADGKPLLTAGTRLTAAHVRTLMHRGFASVAIADPFIPDVQADEALDEATRNGAVAVVKKILDAVAAGQQADLSPAGRAVDEIIDALERRPGRLVNPSWPRSASEETYGHSIGVCVLSLLVGIGLGYSRPDLHKLGVGALLHDIGKAVCGELVTKATPLTAKELERVKTHSRAGYDLLHDRPGISLLSAHVAWQHHERLDGSGYPRGLKGREIHQFARIAAVADVYDALTSDRPYRKRLPPHRVMEYMRTLAGRHLDAKMMGLLFGRLEHYAIGTILTLGTGQVATVTGQTPGQPERPRVRVVADWNHRLVAPYDLDLAEHPALPIQAVLNDYPVSIREQLIGGRCGTE